MGVNIYLESTYYDFGYIYDDLIQFNIDYSSYNNVNGFICFNSYCDDDFMTCMLDYVILDKKGWLDYLMNAS